MEDFSETKIESECKNTVGFAEAENKESFMIGVSVAIRKARDHYEKEIQSLKCNLDSYKKMYENANTDIKTLSKIITKYSENDY